MEQLYGMAARIPGDPTAGTEAVLVAGVGVHPTREAAEQAMTAKTIRGLVDFAPHRLTDTLEVTAVALADTDVVNIIARLSQVRPDLIERAIALTENRNNEIAGMVQGMDGTTEPPRLVLQQRMMRINRHFISFNNSATALLADLTHVRLSVDAANRQITFMPATKGTGLKITMRKGQATVACKAVIEQLGLIPGMRFPVRTVTDGGLLVQV